MNDTGSWAAFHEAAIKLRLEDILTGDIATKGVRYREWDIITARYTSHVL